MGLGDRSIEGLRAGGIRGLRVTSRKAGLRAKGRGGQCLHEWGGGVRVAGRDLERAVCVARTRVERSFQQQRVEGREQQEVSGMWGTSAARIKVGRFRAAAAAERKATAQREWGFVIFDGHLEVVLTKDVRISSSSGGSGSKVQGRNEAFCGLFRV